MQHFGSCQLAETSVIRILAFPDAAQPSEQCPHLRDLHLLAWKLLVQAPRGRTVVYGTHSIDGSGQTCLQISPLAEACDACVCSSSGKMHLMDGTGGPGLRCFKCLRHTPDSSDNLGQKATMPPVLESPGGPCVKPI